MSKKESDFRKFYRSENPYKMTAFDDYVKKQNGYMNPYILEERDLHVTQLDIFSRLMMDRIIYFNSDVDDISASVTVGQLLFLDSTGNNDITMYIMSGGGVISSAFGILDTMDIIKSDIKTVSVGLSASAASLMLSNGTIGKRSSLLRSRILLHEPRIMGSHGITGPYNDMEIEIKEMKILKEMTFGVLAKNTGKTYEEICEDADRDLWLSPEQALNYGSLGIIDSIITKDGLINREGKVGTGEMKKAEKKKPTTRKPKAKKKEETAEEKPAEGKEE